MYIWSKVVFYKMETSSHSHYVSRTTIIYNKYFRKYHLYHFSKQSKHSLYMEREYKIDLLLLKSMYDKVTQFYASYIKTTTIVFKYKKSKTRSVG